MNMVKEFRDFAVRGNVVDMAVGIIVGGAFGKIVSSLVADVVMPPIGIIIGGVNFAGLKVTLKEAEGTAAAVTLNYGQFIQAIVDFTIVAFAIFMMVKAINAVRKKQAEAPPAPVVPTKEEQLLAEIRDILRAK